MSGTSDESAFLYVSRVNVLTNVKILIVGHSFVLLQALLLKLISSTLHYVSS